MSSVQPRVEPRFPDPREPAAVANPHSVTRLFEEGLCRYTGAPYAVAVTSCTMALLLAVAWQLRGERPLAWLQRPRIDIPKRTYVGVPMSIIHAGGRPTFRDEIWRGEYQLRQLPVWDCARRFTSGMYRAGEFQCVSFHATKILHDTQGGAILHDCDVADKWFRKARFDGRTEGVAPIDDTFDTIGYHAYLSPDVSARLLWQLSSLPRYNDDLPCDQYPDLSKHEVFR